MKIKRNNQEFELTRQELFEASEEYRSISAKEMLKDHLVSELNTQNISDEILTIALCNYFSNMDYGCDEEYCLNCAVNTAKNLITQ